ncbi:hypothetical protein [Flammeovirga sp. SJP92]|uniref:hypothetical protein n=1 Tax=Flammeovirga sp. SJP92 TaxID=1775430 RepID=UPI00078772CE|nr:hypothetical protein [Flammeovirga sp. SJP92]KXX66825.1 hypothetical protein AVL50_30295 [Flammeovirga sp. SJP92]
MKLLEYTTIWTKGDIYQGKVMLCIGILLLIAALLILRSHHELLKGMLIPLSLALTLLLGYGGYLTFTRNTHFTNVEAVYKESPAKAIEQEFEKAQKDHDAYSKLKPIWAILMVVSLLSFFIFKTDYLKGVSLGFVALFFIALMVDTTLHYRLKPYYETLSNFSLNNNL